MIVYDAISDDYWIDSIQDLADAEWEIVDRYSIGDEAVKIFARRGLDCAIFYLSTK